MDRKFLEKLYEQNKRCTSCPSKEEGTLFLDQLLALMYPEFEKNHYGNLHAFEAYAGKLQQDLTCLLAHDPMAEGCTPSAIAQLFFDELESLYKAIDQDVEAMYAGDPAAQSRSEVVRCYPGFYAIAAYRIAHNLLKKGAVLLPRIFTEVAHARTGIDIHPGATIGPYFCIDHGTGVVIGETSVIGSHVKIYQGVTLGGLSVDKADARKKRHPTLGNAVVVYAGATILGGDTTVGDHSIIGGNVWLTRSVPPHTKVYYKAAMSSDQGPTDIIEFRDT